MAKLSQQSKRVSYDKYDGITEVQEVLAEIIEGDNDKSALTRLAIVNYELGSLSRMLVYRKVRPKSSRCGAKEDLRTDIGDAIANLIALSDILGISAAEALYEAVERIENMEYNKH